MMGQGSPRDFDGEHRRREADQNGANEATIVRILADPSIKAILATG
jgi:hypothetical protein